LGQALWELQLARALKLRCIAEGRELDAIHLAQQDRLVRIAQFGAARPW